MVRMYLHEVNATDVATGQKKFASGFPPPTGVLNGAKVVRKIPTVVADVMWSLISTSCYYESASTRTRK